MAEPVVEALEVRLTEAKIVWVRPGGLVGSSTPSSGTVRIALHGAGGITSARLRPGARERDETEIHEEMVVWTRA
jgi:hypothetical protein